MEHSTAEKLVGFTQLGIEDWQGSRRVRLEDVPLTASVGEVLDEACRRLELLDGDYEIALDDEPLKHLQTLAEAGIEADSNVGLVITPEVSAGS